MTRKSFNAVLLMDENPGFRNQIRPEIEACCHKLVGSVGTAARGMELLRTSPECDLILCSLHLPDGSAAQILQEIRSKESSIRAIPFILILTQEYDECLPDFFLNDMEGYYFRSYGGGQFQDFLQKWASQFNAMQRKSSLMNLFTQGHYYERRKNYEAALQIYKELHNELETATTHFNMGRMLGILGERDDAFFHFEKAMALDSAMFGIIDNFVRVHLPKIPLKTMNNQELQKAIYSLLYKRSWNNSDIFQIEKLQTVLMVLEKRRDQDAFRHLLAKINIPKVVIGHGAAEVLKLVQDHRFDWILFDFFIEETNCIDLLQKIRLLGVKNFLSSVIYRSEIEPYLEDCFENGMSWVVPYPTSFNGLVRSLNEMLAFNFFQEQEATQHWHAIYLALIAFSDYDFSQTEIDMTSFTSIDSVVGLMAMATIFESRNQSQKADDFFGRVIQKNADLLSLCHFFRQKVAKKELSAPSISRMEGDQDSSVVSSSSSFSESHVTGRSDFLKSSPGIFKIQAPQIKLPEDEVEKKEPDSSGQILEKSSKVDEEFRLKSSRIVDQLLKICPKILSFTSPQKLEKLRQFLSAIFNIISHPTIKSKLEEISRGRSSKNDSFESHLQSGFSLIESGLFEALLLDWKSDQFAFLTPQIQSILNQLNVSLKLLNKELYQGKVSFYESFDATIEQVAKNQEVDQKNREHLRHLLYKDQGSLAAFQSLYIGLRGKVREKHLSWMVRDNVERFLRHSMNGEELQGFLLKQGDFHNALIVLLAIHKHYPSNCHYLRSIAISCLKIRRYEETISFAKKIVELEPHDPDAYNLMGIACKKQNKIHEAIKYYLDGIVSNPLSSKLHHNLAIAYYMVGEKEKGLQAQLDCKNLEVKKSA